MLDSLQETPSAEIDAARDREIEARVAAYERGESATLAAEDVLAEAR
jgi:hypothetical protein